MWEIYSWWTGKKYYTSAQIRKIQKKMKKSYKKAEKIQKKMDIIKKKEEQEAEQLLDQIV